MSRAGRSFPVRAYIHIDGRGSIALVDTGITVTVTAYDASPLSTFGVEAATGVVVTAFDSSPISTAGAGLASVTVTAFDATVNLMNTGVAPGAVTAFDASVAIGASAELVNITVTARDAGIYYSTPPNRTMKVPKERRNFRISNSVRSMKVPREKRSWDVRRNT